MSHKEFMKAEGKKNKKQKYDTMRILILYLLGLQALVLQKV